ncbi:zinc finger protein 782-like [Sabethes cyaneus]|uniref:zinc finger protein 782-like n=1 Tax=Sabethes cyaneus TaxID=53552 RepID=UPI00237E8658|nr:zinc finger protein 782-like [Sabethes cyaneus]
MCRLCLEGSSELSISIENDAIRQKIISLFNLKLDMHANLPNKICFECSSKVDDFYVFSEMVQSNEQQLISNITVLPPVSIADVKIEPSITNQVEFGGDPPHSPSSSLEKSHNDTIDMKVEFEILKADKNATPDHSEDEIPLAKRKRKPSKENHLFQDYYTFECETCRKTFNMFKDFSKHTARVHNKPAVIQCCNRKFTNKFHILNHIKNHLDPNRFRCACGKRFTEKSSYKQHLSKHVGDYVVKPLKCDHCSTRFKTHAALNSHQKIHAKVQCTVCQKIMAGEKTLQTHMTSVHDSVNARKYICDCCGQEFRSSVVLDRHINRQHLGVKEARAQCDLCGTWLNKTNMRAHMKTVHIEANSSLTCDICHNVYPNKKCLVMHKKRVHVEEKFECELCGKKFKRKISLLEHRATHSGTQTLYECDVCGKTTNSNGNLYSHKKTKHPKEWLEAKKKVAQDYKGGR